MDGFSSFLTVMAAVSVAVERVVEIFKGSLSSVQPFKWLFTPKSVATPSSETIRCAALHMLAGTIGTVIAALSRIDVWNKLGVFQVPNHTPHIYYYWGSYAFTGLLSSGGSAIWNHALDILKATKVKQEQGAKAVTANNIAQSTDAAKMTPMNLGNTPTPAVPNPSAVIV